MWDEGNRLHRCRPGRKESGISIFCAVHNIQYKVSPSCRRLWPGGEWRCAPAPTAPSPISIGTTCVTLRTGRSSSLFMSRYRMCKLFVRLSGFNRMGLFIEMSRDPLELDPYLILRRPTAFPLEPFTSATEDRPNIGPFPGPIPQSFCASRRSSTQSPVLQSKEGSPSSPAKVLAGLPSAGEHR